MKQVKLFVCVCLLGTLLFASCKTFKQGDVIPGTTSSKVDSVSYALGVFFAGNIKGADFGELRYAQIEKGFNDMLNDKDLKVPQEEIMQFLQNYMMQRQSYKAEKNVEDAKAFFEKNKEKEGIIVTESGLQYRIVSEGTGIAPTFKDTVEVNYKGTLLDGTVFDSSYERNEPAKFPLGAVIKGWSEGLSYAKEGGKIEIYIPSELGYGPQNYGPIPGNSALIFEVELIKVYPFVEAPAEPEKPAKKIVKK